LTFSTWLEPLPNPTAAKTLPAAELTALVTFDVNVAGSSSSSSAIASLDNSDASEGLKL
jgi:hypothetical protein